MYDQHLYTKVVRFQRAAVDNTFAIFTSLQGYGENILKKSLEQNPWLPETSKVTCMGLTDTCLHGSKNLRKFIDQGFDEMERLVAGTATTQERERPAKNTHASQPAAAAKKQKSRKKSVAPPKPTGKASDAESTGSVSTAGKKPAAMTEKISESKPAPKLEVVPAAAPVTSSPDSAHSATAATGIQPPVPSDKSTKAEIKTTGKTS
jgi:hypothetical protein